MKGPGRLRIAMISYYLPSGSKIGVGYQVHALANALVDRGHEVTVFSACPATPGAKYQIHTVALDGRHRTFKFALRVRELDLTDFDVLHAHGDDYWLWRRRVAAHVRTLHGSCFSEALHISGGRERLRMLLLGLSEVLASLVADRTVAVSEATRSWTPWVRSVIRNGVDVSQFRPRQRSPQPTVLFVGTYGNRKRGRLLADAFSREVLPVLPGSELWMVCEDAHAGPGIKVLGRVSDEELRRLYGEAWVFCLPSTYEGFGIPYIEAMASGCPVVATPNPGALEVTADGRLGVLVEEARLGQALIDLLRSPAERVRLAEVAIGEVGRFDLRRVAADYEALYRDLVATRRAG